MHYTIWHKWIYDLIFLGVNSHLKIRKNLTK
jgi:hypothetical protein